MPVFLNISGSEDIGSPHPPRILLRRLVCLLAERFTRFVLFLLILLLEV
jgi:hypothetical protein